MFTRDFNFYYPSELIAKQPLNERDQARMMVLNRENKQLIHQSFIHFPQYFKEGDVLVFNNTKVLPAKLWGTKITGGKVEVLLVKCCDHQLNLWECLIKPARGIKPNTPIYFSFRGKIIEAFFQDTANKIKTILFPKNLSVYDLMESEGEAPLPPYMQRSKGCKNDLVRYQTIYAKQEGAIAAPTAGLHFTDKIFDELRKKGVQIHFVTLHVGLGTFEPVRVEKIQDHPMHEEFYEVPQQTVEAVLLAKKEKRSITAIGTTSVRALESFFSNDLFLRMTTPPIMSTRLFIYPGYEFKIIDRLFTNFHQPESTLIMLTSAFAGKEYLFEAYEEAVREKYRLFSYGDCMLIL